MEMSVALLAWSIVTCLVWVQSTANPDPFHDIAAQASRCTADAQEPWSFRGSNGPAYWGESYPKCHGARQSPIRIDSSRARPDEDLDTLGLFLYDVSIVNATILNNGKTIALLPDYPLARSVIVNDTYYGLFEVHFRWGTSKRRGSEHIVDGVQYAMEMQLLHKTYFGDYLAVAVLFEQDDGINAELQHIVNELPKVLYKDSHTVTRYRINPFNLLPENLDYYMYDGSLTIPDCSEGLKWIVLKTPVLVGNTQIREFRKVFSTTQDEATDGCRMSNNIRPTQHLHGRTVLSSC